MKKLIAMLLCLVMVLGLFAGCGGGGEEEEVASHDENTIIIGIPQNLTVTDYYDNAYTKWLEEETGYTIEFQMFPTGSADYQTVINGMILADADMPDLLVNFDLGVSQTWNQMGKDGAFLDLAPYFNDREKSQQFWDNLEVYDEDMQYTIISRLTNEDGEMFSFPSLEYTVIDTMDYMPWINVQWLEAVGKEKPTNPDELLEVLRAFRDNDPNGNGVQDELPLMGAMAGLSGDVIAWLINMYVRYDMDRLVSVDPNGQLINPATTDSYREALKYINTLISEGLLNPMCFSLSAPDLAKMTCPAAGEPVVGIAVGHATGAFTPGDEHIMQYECLPLFADTYAVVNENRNKYNIFVTSKCPNPDQVWDLLMTMSSKESSVRLRYGAEGQEWDWADEGEVSYMGIPAEIKLYRDIWGEQQNSHWMTVAATCMVYSEGEAVQTLVDQSPVVTHKQGMFKELRESYDTQLEVMTDMLPVPALEWTDAEIEQYGSISTNVTSYITKSRSEFCVGELDPFSDEDWNNYLKSLEDLGLQEYMEQQQWCYDRVVSDNRVS